jgi:hypothetical protein
MNRHVIRAASAVGWVLIVAVIAIGAAGLIGATAHQPGTASRAELTYAADRAIEPGLSAAESELATLADEVAQLADLGRTALGALVTSKLDALDKAVSDGEQLAIAIQVHAGRLRETLQALPGIGPGEAVVLSPAIIQRHQRALDALAATDGLAAAWTRLSAGSVSAARVTTLLAEHDQTTAAAAASGKLGKYTDALATLAKSDDIIAKSRSLRDSLASTVDVTTLTQWLDLNAEYDTALRALYQSLVDSKGAVTKKVRDAFAVEKAAHDRLPGDTKALVIILAEIGRGGLNQAVIGIEEARGTLAAVVGQLSSEPGASASP